jgi:hypothetical protein
MDRKLWTALQELLDQADYAVEVLGRYQDWEDHPYDLQPTPNNAMIAYSGLKKAAERVNEMLAPIDTTTELEER